MKVAIDFARWTTIKVALVVGAICSLTPSAAHAADVTLSGSAFYRERMALPDDAALIVELVDPAKPETLIGKARVEPSGQVPIAFSLVVDSGKFAAGQAYAFRARIEVDGAPGSPATSRCQSIWQRLGSRCRSCSCG